MKLDIVLMSAIIGVGLALFLERFFNPIVLPGTSTSSATVVLTGDPVRDYMELHYI